MPSGGLKAALKSALVPKVLRTEPTKGETEAAGAAPSLDGELQRSLEAVAAAVDGMFPAIKQPNVGER